MIFLKKKKSMAGSLFIIFVDIKDSDLQSLKIICLDVVYDIYIEKKFHDIAVNV